MELALFGSGGNCARIEVGDVVVMHVGVSYAMAGSSGGVLVVGGYHNGRDWDNIREAHLNEEARRAAVMRDVMLFRSRIEVPSLAIPFSGGLTHHRRLMPV
ncbi:MAG: hypothetical protein J4F49_08920 [Rhodobacteraceae bacterium]|nr:hypothetical protein [Paracoccaceae bacterium]